MATRPARAEEEPPATEERRPLEPSPPERSRRELSGRQLGTVFMAPSVAVMLVIALFPVIYAFVLSLYAYSGRQRLGFSGLDNYAAALTSSRFWDSLQATAVFTVTSVAAEFLIGLGFALVMNQTFRGRGLTRALILIPWVIPTVVAAQMWSILFNIHPGFINTLLNLGDFNWLGQRGWAMVSIVFADVWKTAPFVALLLLAGLQTIPGDVYESAHVDGASARQRFWYITFPLLKPAILVALLFRTIQALRVYDLPQVMTFGQFGTETLAILVQRYVIRTVDLGFGSALSTLTFAIVLAVGVLFVQGLGKELVMGRGR